VPIIPAIDLQNGEAVRLFQGDYAQKTVYSQDPVKLAQQFETMGAKYLHIVDLDGAKDGNTANLETIRRIRENVALPIQVGGGIRTAETVAMYLDELDVNRVILGTVAVENPDFVSNMIASHGAERIVVGVDVRDGKVAVSGWLQDSGADYLDFIETLKDIGVKYIVVTDIGRDGTLTSPNWDMYEQISGINVVVSGGVSGEADVHRARKYYGVIVGKAFYEGKLDLQEILAKRIIPCLDTVDGRVVKGVNFVDLVDIGDPIEIAKRYQKQGADEIVILDITATNEGRDTTYDLLRRASEELTIPLTLGGGIRTVDDVGKALECGASKVSISSAAVNNPKLIREASEKFGSERIVVAIDGREREVMVNGGRKGTGLDIAEWAQKCEALGAGEILFTSMSGDGTQDGYDITHTRAICEAVNIPVIASGGCGSVQDIIDVFEETDCDAALVASLFHYGKATVEDVKAAMKKESIPCR